MHGDPVNQTGQETFKSSLGSRSRQTFDVALSLLSSFLDPIAQCLIILYFLISLVGSVDDDVHIFRANLVDAKETGHDWVAIPVIGKGEIFPANPVSF